MNDALFYDAETDSYEITVNADDKGRVRLSGRVDSWQERELAETVTKWVSGVTSVDNTLIINSESKRSMPKSSLKSKNDCSGIPWWITP